MANGHGGARPRSGPPKGYKQKRTIEAEEQARLAQQRAAILREGEAERATKEMIEARSAGVKLAKDVLEQFMMIFAGQAAKHQPLKEGVPVPEGRLPNEVKFLEYAKLAVGCARDLAPYQSPTYRAIVVAPAPTANPADNSKRFTLRIFEGGLSPAGSSAQPEQLVVISPPSGNGHDDDGNGTGGNGSDAG